MRERDDTALKQKKHCGLLQAPFFRMMQGLIVGFIAIFALRHSIANDAPRMTVVSIILFAYAGTLFWYVWRAGLFGRR